jgi:hypothetical protein
MSVVFIPIFCSQAFEPTDLQRDPVLPIFYVPVRPPGRPVLRRAQKSLCFKHYRPRVNSI